MILSLEYCVHTEPISCAKSARTRSTSLARYPISCVCSVGSSVCTPYASNKKRSRGLGECYLIKALGAALPLFEQYRHAAKSFAFPPLPRPDAPCKQQAPGTTPCSSLQKLRAAALQRIPSASRSAPASRCTDSTKVCAARPALSPQYRVGPAQGSVSATSTTNATLVLVRDPE